MSTTRKSPPASSIRIISRFFRKKTSAGRSRHRFWNFDGITGFQRNQRNFLRTFLPRTSLPWTIDGDNRLLCKRVLDPEGDPRGENSPLASIYVGHYQTGLSPHSPFLL